MSSKSSLPFIPIRYVDQVVYIVKIYFSNMVKTVEVDIEI